MSKTQQVKQYKKQIDQLGTEVATYREQAEVHKSQVRGSVCELRDVVTISCMLACVSFTERLIFSVVPILPQYSSD